MGTSASGGGASGRNPLIPTWISQGGLSPLPPPQKEPTEQDQDGYSGTSDNDNNNSGGDNINSDEQAQDSFVNVGAISSAGQSRRFTDSRTQFNKYVSSGGANTSALKSALKNYSRKAAGGTQGLARRMMPATSRVATFYDVVDGMKRRGSETILRQFNLESYKDKTVVEILSAFSDIIFRNTGKAFEDTQDDSIVRQAYSETVIKISEISGIDLDNLTNEQVEVMMAIFVEETIVHRVINDIGDGLTDRNTNVKDLIGLEEDIHQVVCGLVRNQIMPEIIATNRGDKSNLEQKIENIYRQALDVLAGQ